MHKLSRKIDLKIFLCGVVLTLLLYGALWGYLVTLGKGSLAGLEKSLASQVVDITRASNNTPVMIKAERGHDTPNKAPEDVEGNQEATAHTEVPSPTPAPIKPISLKIPVIDGLFGKQDGYNIPLKVDVGQSSVFDAYRKHFEAPATPMNGHLYALVFTDFGLSPSHAEALLNTLPKDITLVISPYSDEPRAIRDFLGDHEYESWLSIPMETNLFPNEDPGPKALLSRNSFDKNKESLYWALARANGYAGIAAYSDSAFAIAKPTLGALMNDVFARGLAYVDLNSDGAQQIESIADRLNAFYGKAHLNFAKYSRGYHDDNYAELATGIIGSRKSTILVFPMNTAAIRIAQETYRKAQAEGHILAPLSYILDPLPKKPKEVSHSQSQSKTGNHENGHAEPGHNDEHH